MLCATQGGIKAARSNGFGANAENFDRMNRIYRMQNPKRRALHPAPSDPVHPVKNFPPLLKGAGLWLP
jgi:hypothetical protein